MLSVKEDQVLRIDLTWKGLKLVQRKRFPRGILLISDVKVIQNYWHLTGGIAR